MKMKKPADLSGWVSLSSLIPISMFPPNSPSMLGRDIPANPMSVFKHEVFCYTLDKKYCDMKSLYLYSGYSRVVKAICPAGSRYMELTFYSVESAMEWDHAEEVLNSDIPWIYRIFYKRYKQIHTDKVKMRVYQRI